MVKVEINNNSGGQVFADVKGDGKPQDILIIGSKTKRTIEFASVDVLNRFKDSYPTQVIIKEVK